MEKNKSQKKKEMRSSEERDKFWSKTAEMLAEALRTSK